MSGSESKVVKPILGGGEMGRLVREFDWANNPLGPIESWSTTLRAAVDLVLSSSFPLLLVWGPEHIQIYNDALIPLLANKHPATLGQNFRTSWTAADATIEQAFEGILAGTTPLMEDQLLFTDRLGYLEEAFFTYSYNPVRDESGTIRGMLVWVTDSTAKVLASRRTRVLLDVSGAGLQAQSLEDALVRAATSLARAAVDLPFALFYRIDIESGVARLIASAGLAADTPAAPSQVSLAEEDRGWPIARVARSGESVQLDDLATRFPNLTAGPYPEPIQSARAQAILPSKAGGQVDVRVVLITGFSTRRPINEAHVGFHELLATTIGQVVASATAAEARQQQLEALASIDRAKSAFFANISHEFRTPLTLMLAPLEDELSEPNDALPELRRARLELAHRNALRLLTLVNSLLEFSNYDAGRTRASFEPIDLATYTIELAEVFRVAVERAGLRLTIECPPLPEPIFVDREMWEHVVFNLLSNAIKHTFEGGIRVGVRARDRSVVLEVEDTGVGIPAAELPRLFDRFHRVRGARSRTHEGSGLGLALVHDAARLHGGTVEVTSQEERGSCFRVTLPMGSAHLPADLVELRAVQQPKPNRTAIETITHWLPTNGAGAPLSPDEATGRGRILWVEDNADLREYVQRLLSPRWDVRAVENGARALEAIRVETPDLVLTDVMMPELDGIELLRVLRSDPMTRHVPVIVLSARAGPASSMEGLEAGADDYLVKPFTARELLARIRSHISLGRARHALAVDLARKVEERTAELERITAELRRSEQQFQQLTSAIDEAFWVSDVATRAVLYISPAYERIWGRSRQSVYERPRGWLETVHPEEREEVSRRATEATEGNGLFNAEYRIVRPDGVVRWVHARTFPIFDGNGSMYRLAGVAADITDRKSAEAERRSLEWQLQQSQKLEALGTLTGGIAHDFNNLLAAILGNVELARQDLEPGHVVRESVEEIHAAGLRAKELVQRLLSFSRPAERQRTSFQLKPVLEEAVRLMRAALPAGVELHLDASAPLPAIEGEPSSIHQIALNLITNAWHALGGKAGRIDVQLAPCRVDSSLQQKSPELRPGPHVRLSVRDNGAGIPAHVLNRIFEPFFTTKAPGTGTGLGLSVVHGIVRSHGGAILVDTALGRGSTFHVYLPANTATTAPVRGAPAGGHAPPGRGERILFIDDEPALVRLALTSLGRLGYRVVAFEQPGDALAAFRADPAAFDLVITDYNMPQMSGVEVAQQLARIRPGVKIALITGYLRPDEIERAQASGICEIILKPISVVELGPVVRRLLSEPSAFESVQHRVR